jgi:hypothetical protein
MNAELFCDCCGWHIDKSKYDGSGECFSCAEGGMYEKKVVRKLEFELGCFEEDFEAIRNFYKEAKYLILLGEQGESKVVVLK